MVVTITRDGFIKRTPLETFRAQNRGGRGRTAAGTRGDDIVARSFNAHTHQWVLFFSSGGKAFREKVWRLPEASPTAKGRALVNLLPELGSDQITTVLPLAAGRDAVGQPASRVCHSQRHRASQPPLRFRPHTRKRPHCHETRRGRPAHRRRYLPRRRRRVPRHPPRPLHTLPDFRRNFTGFQRKGQRRRTRHQAWRRRRG